MAKSKRELLINARLIREGEDNPDLDAAIKLLSREEVELIIKISEKLIEHCGVLLAPTQGGRQGGPPEHVKLIKKKKGQ